jgi:glutamate-ammonia-ligase adenylyltransferase
MRARLREQHPAGDPLKHGPGGLLDIDFLAQLGVLSEAGRAPGLCDATATQAQLAALGDNGWLDPGETRVLMDTHQALTRARHLQALCRGGCKKAPDTSRAAEICRRYDIVEPA